MTLDRYEVIKQTGRKEPKILKFDSLGLALNVFNNLSARAVGKKTVKIKLVQYKTSIKILMRHGKEKSNENQ